MAFFLILERPLWRGCSYCTRHAGFWLPASQGTEQGKRDRGEGPEGQREKKLTSREHNVDTLSCDKHRATLTCVLLLNTHRNKPPAPIY